MFAKVSVYRFQVYKEAGPIVQGVTGLTANQGVASLIPTWSKVVSLIPTWSHTVMGIGDQKISMVILLLPQIQEGLFQLHVKVMAYARSTG